MVYKAPTLESMALEIEFLRGEDLNLTSGNNPAASAMSFDNLIESSRRRNKSFEQVSQLPEESVVDYLADLNEIDDKMLSSNGLPIITPSQIFANGRESIFFLTGVTGFLGAFILQSIFNTNPNSIVWCLVRSKTDALGKERVIENCKKHLIDCDAWANRIRAVSGDLGSDKFGLTSDVWKHLCENIDVIIHNGALVHWIYPYKKLRGPNVVGTVTALRLSCEHHLKPLHFISSTAVLESPYVIIF
jgi:L-aminoadipate-semialdehyde dehydrogenase